MAINRVHLTFLAFLFAGSVLALPTQADESSSGIDFSRPHPKLETLVRPLLRGQWLDKDLAGRLQQVEQLVSVVGTEDDNRIFL